MAEIIAICLEEKDLSIDQAYKEGYKAGAIEFEPEIAALNTKINLLNENNEFLKSCIQNNGKQDVRQNILYASLGFLAGNITGCIITLKLSP